MMKMMDLFRRSYHNIVRTLVERPTIVIVIILVAFFVCSFCSFFLSDFVLDTDAESFVVKGSEISLRREKFVSLMINTVFGPEDDSFNDFELERSNPGNLLALIYEAGDDIEDQNVMSPEFLARIRDFERDLVENVTGYSEFCQLDYTTDDVACSPPLSIINFIYPSISSNGSYVYDGKGDFALPPELVLQELREAAPRLFDFFVGSEWNDTDASASISSPITRSYFTFGLPLRGFSSSKVLVEEQNEIYADWVEAISGFLHDHSEKDSFRISWFGSILTNIEIDNIVFQDGYWAVGSALFTFFYIWFHVRSLLLAVTGVIGIMMSFPFAYFLFKIVFGINFFSTLNVVSIFVILGIGADDIFIITDSWKQKRVHLLQQHKQQLEEEGGTGNPPLSIDMSDPGVVLDRMKYTYSRSIVATGTTSITTTVAFFANVVSSVVPIKLFGIFSGIIVMTNYLLMCTWYCAWLVIWSRKYELKPSNSSNGKKYGSFLSSLISNFVSILNKKKQNSSPPEIEFKTIHTEKNTDSSTSCTFYNLNNGEEENNDKNSNSYNENKSDNNKIIENVDKKREDLEIGNGGGGGKIDDVKTENNIVDYRKMEKFFYEISPKLYKFRFVIIAFFIILLLLAGISASNVQGQSEQIKFFPDDNWIQRAGVFERYGFRVSEAVVQLRIVWGTSDYDGSTADTWDPLSYGVPVYNPDFDISEPSSQVWFLDTCELIRNQPTTRNGEVSCFMEDFRDYRLASNLSFPVEQESFDQAFLDFVFWAKNNLLSPSLGLNSITSHHTSYSDQIRYGYDDNSNLKLLAVSVIVNTTFIRKSARNTLLPLYNDWTDFCAQINLVAPPGLDTSFHHCFMWDKMELEKLFVTGAFFGCLIASILALVVVIFATGNFIISFLAIGSILGVVLSILGVMPLLGWDLGVSESICITILVGISVDYALHLALSYMHVLKDPLLGLKSRKKIVQKALQQMGISVFSASITTFGASVLLFFCTVSFFVRFGQFVSITIFLSAFFAFGLFVALVGAMGPVGDLGDLVLLCSRVRQFFLRKRLKS